MSFGDDSFNRCGSDGVDSEDSQSFGASDLTDTVWFCFSFVNHEPHHGD